jgi:D-3-phosphoglycerate dehydrogenase / 2-oxoglutarate reductase
MKSYSVLRTHLSPYQSSDFNQREKALLERLPGVTYLDSAPTSLDAPLILITNTHTRLRELSSRIVEKVELIVHPNSGYDNFHEDFSIWNNIPIVVGHEIRSQAVAEWSLAALFEGCSGLPQHMSWNKSRRWDRKLLKRTSVAIFGYGHIGKKIADALALIGMNVVVIDPFINSCPHHICKRWEEIDLSKVEVVIAAMGLNSTSKKIFNQDFFSKAHSQLLFINGARGGLVDEKALREFLLTHPESFAFLDVFDPEPFGEEWHHFPQVWKTSHIAGVHAQLDQGILDFEYKVIQDFLKLPYTEFNINYQRELLQNKWMSGELI